MACSLSYISSITGDCSNLSLGSFSIDIQGFAPDYTIQWLSPDYGTIPLGAGVTGYTINSLSAGTYSFNILDSCNSPGITTVPVNIYISSGTCVSITNQRNTTCNFNNGSITAQTQYQYGTSKFYLYENTIGYLSSGSTLNSNFSFNSLSPGIYYVIGDDGGGCTGKSETCIIKSSTTLDYGFYVVNDAGCNVNSGKIFVTGLIGNPPYTYLWSNGGTLSSITGLTNGPYSVTVTDNTGCSISKSTEVVKVPQIGLGGFTSISPGCFTNNGELTVFITGGTAPYYYSASTGESNVSFDPQYTFTNVPGGSISVYAQDAGLCSFVASTTLQTPSGFNVVSVNVVNSKCGYSNGIISILLNGTNGNIVYTLTDSNNDSIENETSSLSWSFNNLKSDTYTLTISNGVCVYTNTYTVINESLYDINILTTGTTCNTPNGAVNIEIVGGIPPYTINIGSQSLIGTSLSSVTFTNLVSDSYVVQITDSSPTPCRQTQSFEIDSSENVGVLLVKTDIINVNDGTINVYITGGTPTFDLQWSSNVNGQTGYSITNLSAGTYTLIVTDSDNCVKETSIKIYGYDKLSSYESYTICDSDFEDIGELGKYGIYEMYYDGYYTHVSGFTNCILDSATFKLIVTIGNVEKYNDFYVSNSLTDYPFDNEYYDVLKGLVDSFDQVSQTIIDPISNQIQIITKCDEEFLVPARVVVSLDIDYSISCQDCGSVPSLSPTPTPTPTITPTPTSIPLEEFIINAVGVNQIYSTEPNSGFTITSSLTFKINWGDGNIETFPSGTTRTNHIYSSPYTGQIKILSTNLTTITVFESNTVPHNSQSLWTSTSELQKLDGLLRLITFGSNGLFITGNVLNLPRTITYLNIFNNNLNGDTSDLPPSLINMFMFGNNTISGNTSGFPNTLTGNLYLQGNNTVSGDTSDLPRMLTGSTMNIQGYNTISGDTSGLPMAREIRIMGNNTISGDVLNLPVSLLTCQIDGLNTISGDVLNLPPSIQVAVFNGYNTISGDVLNLPRTLIGISFEGYNTITGNISTLPPNLISAYFQNEPITTLVTIFGDISTLPPSLRFFVLTSTGIVSGNLSNIPTGIERFALTGNITVSYSSGRVWASNYVYLLINPTGSWTGFTSTETDNLLIDIQPKYIDTTNNLFRIKCGSTPKRTSASDAAFAALQTLIGAGIVFLD